MKAKYIIGGIIILIFVVWGAMAFLKTTVSYVSFEQARESSRTVQVAGHIDFDRVEYDLDNQRLVFDIYEMDPQDPVSPDRLTVVYHGVVPGNFDQATSIVVRGKPEDDLFMAEQLLVKCPSKYQGAAVELEDI
jgi:cytochrome c-type biogenesis protein CcmE